MNDINQATNPKEGWGFQLTDILNILADVSTVIMNVGISLSIKKAFIAENNRVKTARKTDFFTRKTD